ncbi:MAG: PCRF domain-containing protein, partial [Deltaproteobacteria bacterium]
MLVSRLEEVTKHYESLSEALSRPEVIANQVEFRRMAKEHADLSTLMERFQTYKTILQRIAENEALTAEEDPEIAELAREELPGLRQERARLEGELQRLLLPKDPNDEKNVMLEIRAGTGGEEAALFAADLFRMYSRYAERRGWRIERMSANETGIGGYKEIIVMIEGKGAYSRLKYESGVHRVQRVPVTETQG